jgi:hypothetical protein
MGFDRGVLPKDRILVAVWLAFGAFGDGEEPSEIPGSDSRGLITLLI